MQFITQALAAGLLGWLALLALIILTRALSGELKTDGLLAASRGEGVAPERALSMLVFPVVIASYAYLALQVDVGAKAALPDVPEQLMMLLTGSNGIYLAGQIARKK